MRPFLRYCVGVVLAIVATNSQAVAATPTVDASTSGAIAATTSHSPTLPTCASGKLLVATISVDGNATTSAWTAGWNNLAGLTDEATFTTIKGDTYYKISNGSDTLSFTSSASVPSAYVIRCFGGAHASAAPEGSTALATGTSGAPDPATSGTVSWGSDTNLFCAAVFYDRGGSAATVNGYPTNYTTDQKDTSASSAGQAVAGACKAASADSDDPSAFSLTASDNWMAGTYVVRPASTQSQAPRSMHQYRLRRQ